MAARRQTPPSWAVADRLSAQGVAAIIAPSIAPGASLVDRNVVFWRWADTLPHQVRVIDDLFRLPRDQASWR